MRKGKKFILNTIILSLTSLFMRTVGVSFNVYISNKLGASGVGLFQLVMSVYTFAVTLASSGINLATTRLVTEELAKGSARGARLAVRRCLGYSLFFGSSAAIGLFLFAKPIGEIILSDARTVKSLYALSISLIPIALSAVLSGYFTAVRRVIKSASAQIFEQFVRISIAVMGLSILAPKGIEYACLAIVAGGSIAEILSFVYEFVLYKSDIKRCKGKMPATKGMLKRLISIAMPVAISSYARSALTTTEHILVPPKLREFGYSKEIALAKYGVVHGMVLPVLLFPSAFLTSFSLLLVPELAECNAHKNIRRIHYIISRVFHVTLIFAIGVSGIFFAFSNELGMVIYKSAEAGMYLKIFAPLIIVMYLDSVVDGMLKGLNQQLSSMQYNVIDSLVSVVMVCLLIPKFGIGGFVAVIFVCELLNGFLSLNRLIKVTDFKIEYYNWIIKPFFAIISSVTIVKLLIFFFAPFAELTIFSLVCQIAGAVLIYLLFLLIMSCVTGEHIGLLRSVVKK